MGFCLAHATTFHQVSWKFSCNAADKQTNIPENMTSLVEEQI